MNDKLRQELSEALAPINEDYAGFVKDPESEVETYPAPFLNDYKIYKVLYYHPNKPIQFYVGYAEGKKAYLLTGSLENYAAMAKADKVKIDSAKTAARYVEVALEATRSMSQLVYLVKSVDDVMFQKLLEDDEEGRKKQFMKEYAERIKAPHGEPQGDGYSVTAYVVREQTLERHTVKVSKDGDLKPEVDVLESDLPLMFGGR